MALLETTSLHLLFGTASPPPLQSLLVESRWGWSGSAGELMRSTACKCTGTKLFYGGRSYPSRCLHFQHFRSVFIANGGRWVYTIPFEVANFDESAVCRRIWYCKLSPGPLFLARTIPPDLSFLQLQIFTLALLYRDFHEVVLLQGC